MDDICGEEAWEWGLGTSPRGDVEQEASGRDLLQETRQNLWSGGSSPAKHGNTGIHFLWNLLITSLRAPGWARGRLSVRTFPYFSYGRGCPSLYPVLSSVFLDHWSNIRLACVCLSSSGHFPSVFPAPFAGHSTAGNTALLSTGAQVCGMAGSWVCGSEWKSSPLLRPETSSSATCRWGVSVVGSVLLGSPIPTTLLTSAPAADEIP